MLFTFSQRDSIHRGGETDVQTHLFLFAQGEEMYPTVASVC